MKRFWPWLAVTAAAVAALLAVPALTKGSGRSAWERKKAACPILPERPARGGGELEWEGRVLRLWDVSPETTVDPRMGLIRTQFDAAQALAKLRWGEDLDRERERAFTNQELRELGFDEYFAFGDVPELRFCPVPDAPGSEEELMTALEKCFYPGAAEGERDRIKVYCLFEGGQMWHLLSRWEGPEWERYDWNTLEIWEDTGERIVFGIEGAVSWMEGERELWTSTLQWEEGAGWRFREFNRRTTREYEARRRRITLTGLGFTPGTPLRDLPEELRGQLKPVGESWAQNGEPWGLYQRYAAPGLELTTSRMREKELRRITAEDEAEYREELGKEYVYLIRITGGDYATGEGIRVGDTLEQCREKGWELQEGENTAQLALEWLRVTVKDGVVTELFYHDGGRLVGKYFY